MEGPATGPRSKENEEVGGFGCGLEIAAVAGAGVEMGSTGSAAAEGLPKEKGNTAMGGSLALASCSTDATFGSFAKLNPDGTANTGNLFAASSSSCRSFCRSTFSMSSMDSSPSSSNAAENFLEGLPGRAMCVREVLVRPTRSEDPVEACRGNVSFPQSAGTGGGTDRESSSLFAPGSSAGGLV